MNLHLAACDSRILTYKKTAQKIQSVHGRKFGATTNSLMLTTDEKHVDIDFSGVWNVKSAPRNFKFSLADSGFGRGARFLSQHNARELIANHELAPILNPDRARH